MVVLALLALSLLLALPYFLLFHLKQVHRFPYLALASPRDIVLGSTMRWLSFPLLQARLSHHEQGYHAAIWGRSGAGKSKLLESLLLQHVALGNGVGVLEPHHDLSHACLTSLIASGFYRRPDAYERVIYIDWGNGGYVPFNILRSRAAHHTIAANVLEAFHRVWPALAAGAAPAFDNIVKRGVRVLLANDLPLTKLERLVVDHPWRAQLLKNVHDDGVLTYWQTFFDGLTTQHRLDEIKSALRRLSLLTDNPLLKLTLGQRGNALDFRAIMDGGKAVIINLGSVGDAEARKLIGALVMIQIEQAALSRTSMPPEERTPFTLLLDEWPAFVAQGETISHILSQCRKFNLRLYLAAQSVSQIDSRQLAGALENTRLQIVFGLGRDSAEAQARQIGMIEPHQVKEEKATATQHTLYTAPNEQWELWTQELQSLKSCWAYVKLEGAHALKIRTRHVPSPRLDPAQVKDILARYQARYQKSQAEAEAEVETEPSEPAPKPAYHQLFD